MAAAPIFLKVAPDLQPLPLERPFDQHVEVRGDDRLQLAVPDQLRQKEMIRVRLAEIEELEKPVQRGIPAQRFDERLEGQPRAHHHLNFFPRRACGREGAGNELAHQREPPLTPATWESATKPSSAARAAMSLGTIAPSSME